MPTIVSILTFISRIISIFESLKTRKIFNLKHFSFYEQLEFHVELSMMKKVYKLEARLCFHFLVKKNIRRL